MNLKLGEVFAQELRALAARFGQAASKLQEAADILDGRATVTQSVPKTYDDKFRDAFGDKAFAEFVAQRDAVFRMHLPVHPNRADPQG